MYRNPGLHFGDIHRLKAVHVEALKEIVGNAKYGIFFSINGPRSVGSEIANGDFDGDEYWVSSNPEVNVYTTFYFSVLSLSLSLSPYLYEFHPWNILTIGAFLRLQ